MDRADHIGRFYAGDVLGDLHVATCGEVHSGDGETAPSTNKTTSPIRTIFRPESTRARGGARWRCSHRVVAAPARRGLHNCRRIRTFRRLENHSSHRNLPFDALLGPEGLHPNSAKQRAISSKIISWIRFRTAPDLVPVRCAAPAPVRYRPEPDSAPGARFEWLRAHRRSESTPRPGCPGIGRWIPWWHVLARSASSSALAGCRKDSISAFSRVFA